MQKLKGRVAVVTGAANTGIFEDYGNADGKINGLEFLEYGSY